MIVPFKNIIQHQGGEKVLSTITSHKEKIELKYDRLIDITNFKSLTNTSAINQKIAYGEFLNRISDPMITNEKGNAGGFIGGYVQDRRNKANVKSRSIILIDIDEVPEGVNVWENIEGFTNFAIAMYSTHNHTKENPRYRVIIPLHHDIEPDHYKEVTRYLVDILQVWIDETSCEFERHMHYPTCSNPDNYEFYYQDFPFFDASFITKQHEEIKTFKNNEKADPRTKQNWIGAWTNIHSITDVLDNFLSDKYEPFRNNRYTYVDGSTKGGLIIYDGGLHTHSNHSTDPISGKNVNSFDLYRLHKFSHLDNGMEDMKDKPSYKAMIEHCKKDEKVREYYEKHINFEVKINGSPVIDLKKELQGRYFEELDRLEQEWEANGKKGRKPITISPARCSVILPECISFILFDLEENTRLAMYLPEEGIYTQNATVIKRVISWLEPKLNNTKAEEVIYHLTNTAEVKEKTNSRYLIPVQNGVFNLKTKTLEPFTADYVFTTKIATPYYENPVNPVIDGWDVVSWVKSIACGDLEIENLLWQVMNDALNGNYSRRKAIFLIGEGNNGKGTFQELIMNLIGIKNIATLKVNEFDERFRLSVLEGKTAVIGDDVPANVYIDDSSNFNSVVTGDMVSVEFKNRPIYNTVFRCSVIQSTNGMPKFKNKTNGTIRRIVIVPFKADFNGKAENFKIKDEYIKNEQVLQFVLYKAINMDFEKFDIPKVSLQELEVFKQDNDPVLDFKLSVFDEWGIQEVPKYIVYGFYKNFCHENGYKHLADRQFHKQFKTYLGDGWEDSQKKFRYESLIKYVGDLDKMKLGFGFPDKSKPYKAYKNSSFKIV
ncbi:DNA primase [Bacillus mycoides]|uniref:DNA primase family protein n=1 Tax=Bacillus mycoides TaxID=1405 RepID=UPI001C035E26|nr:DNA primase family protein [Bacillus mycoides]QWH59854.1 DNA primase [Bacillus mycoides]